MRQPSAGCSARTTEPPMPFRVDAPGTPERLWATSIREHQRQAHTSGAAAALLSGVRRLILVAAHPDDETLGASGLLQEAYRANVTTTVVMATDGEASHPGSVTYPPSRLATLRRSEGEAAVRYLSPGATITRLGLPDTSLDRHVAELTTSLVRLIAVPGTGTLVVAPWRRDGHADHEAAGRAAAAACCRTDARLLEYPIWWWHWGDPGRHPWSDTVITALSPDEHARKQAAIRRHRTQVAPLSADPADRTMLGPHVLAHFSRRRECFIQQAPHDDALELLHQARSDPWQVDTSWYEEHKRQVTMAMLPRRRYRRALEIGCSTGRLTLELATRCDRVHAVDSSKTAASRAAARLATSRTVTVEHRAVPPHWPPGRPYDLVVLSEAGYFLSPCQLSALAECIRHGTAPGGQLVLCHWRHRIVGWPLTGDLVHRQFARLAWTTVLAHHEETDFVAGVLQVTGPGEGP